MLRRATGRLELAGRARCGSSCLEWTAMCTRGRVDVPPLAPSTDQRWAVQRAETWNRNSGFTHVLTLLSGEEFRPDTGTPLPPMAVCDDGLAVDIDGRINGTAVRVVGIVSAAHPIELWHDDDFPSLDLHSLELGLHTDDFWLGLFSVEA